MKTTTILLAALLALTACTSAPPASTPASPASPALADTSPHKQVCQKDEATGSRLKRPRCFDIPEGSEKAYRDDLLREKMDELRGVDERNTLQTTENPFGR